MNMVEFRRNEELVTWAHKVMTHRNWRILMDVMMMDEHPMNGVKHEVVPPQSDSRMLGMIDGFNMFNKILQQVKDKATVPKPLEATFAAPEFSSSLK